MSTSSYRPSFSQRWADYKVGGAMRWRMVRTLLRKELAALKTLVFG